MKKLVIVVCGNSSCVNYVSLFDMYSLYSALYYGGIMYEVRMIYIRLLYDTAAPQVRGVISHMELRASGVSIASFLCYAPVMFSFSDLNEYNYQT